MSLMLGKLYDALRSTPDDAKAREAAEEVAGYEKALAEIRTDLKVIQAVMGMIFVLILGVLWQGFTIMGRLPS